MSLTLDNTMSSTGYPNSSISQLNTSRSLSQAFDPNIGPSDTYYMHDPMAIQEPSSLIYLDSLDSLLDQDPLACKDSDNGLVAQLKQQLTKLQHAVASLQADRLRLVNENAGLNMTCQTLQNVIVNMHGSTSLVSLTSSSPLSPSSDTSSTIADEKPALVDRIVPTESDQELDRKDYPSVKSWTRKEWQEQYPKTTSSVPGTSGSSSRGSGRMAQGVNVACTYLQDKKGVPVSAQHTKTIWNLMLSSFRELDSQGLTPDSIGQASLQVLCWLIHTLHKHCPEFCLCADNWKVMKLMTDNYSQWFNYHVKKKTSKRIKAEHGESLLDLSDNTLPPVAQKHAGDPDKELEAEHMKKQAWINEPVTEPASDEAREPTPPPHTNKGKDKEAAAIEIKNPLSDLVLKPRPKPVIRKLPSTSIDSPTASTSGTNLILAPPSNKSTPTSTVPETPSSSTDTASLAVKTELVNQASAAIVIEEKANTIKKHQPSMKPMRVSFKITAQNLCTLDWQSNSHQKELASVFATYWNSLSKTNKEVYKRKAALQLNSAGPTEGSGASDDADEE
ncbi:uncharacterized protein BJ212DRAFT_1490081 [Suillus subaureus]|uniref:Uncharacterized protein n=1 Tax=Suillus subaureus TaxID=48587 RepID=A0A9P7AT16_9AGAM|nr:uncharacterized protein BJ212DRAFT_1490081 [Suillus subaureus]KAG1794481.1 hypothetical protein BJ212DRAFT_1490081 [Suillus subaureus]